MPFIVSADRLRIHFNRFREKLWVKPLAIALLSAGAVFASKLADGTSLRLIVPTITIESVETLLSVMAASMLVIATFAVGSMVAAYSSASNAATPRSFTLVLSDDVSQNALSTFIGAFIFSIVALTAAKNDYFGPAGLFCLFALTIFVFGLVTLTFVRWVDRIARLGRLGETIDKVEKAADGALKRRRAAPTLQGLPAKNPNPPGQDVFAGSVGYVQHVDVAMLQDWAEKADGRVVVMSLPGAFAAPGRALARVTAGRRGEALKDCEQIVKAFQIGDSRLFDDDPRFGLIVLSEIAGRALSPGVNDPGTAIDIVGTLVRLFSRWGAPAAGDPSQATYDRVEVPEVSVSDMFDDAFTAIARDGAASIEVVLRLQKALRSLASLDGDAMREAAARHGRAARARAEKALDQPHDLALMRDAASWATAP
ncbi:MAG: DUF2254 domain-containing protein [Elusimicrobiota bacterium]